MKYTDEEMKELAADLLAIDLGLPSVCPTYMWKHYAKNA